MSPYQMCMACGMDITMSRLQQVQDRPKLEFIGDSGFSTPKQTVMGGAADVENMHWILDPTRWQAFYRASRCQPSSLAICYHNRPDADLLVKVRYRSEDDTLHVSGIGQGLGPAADGFDQVCLWSRSRGNREVCGLDCRHRVDAMEVVRRGKDYELGYAVHAGCWLLLDRILGGAMVKANLQVFKEALRQFWIEDDRRRTFFLIFLIPRRIITSTTRLS